MNLYAYVGNDPVNMIDPSGMYKCRIDGNTKTCEGTNDEVKDMAKEMKDYKVDSATSGFTSDPDAMQSIIDGHAADQMRQYGPQSKQNEHFGFIYGDGEGKLNSAVTKGPKCRDDSNICSVNNRNAGDKIPKGSKVYGEWYTHPHKGSPTLSESDVLGENANYKHRSFYSAYYGDNRGRIYRWDAGLTDVRAANRSRIFLGSY